MQERKILHQGTAKSFLAFRSKLCSGPCNVLSDSGCGLVVILFLPQLGAPDFDCTNTITEPVIGWIVTLTGETFPDLSALTEMSKNVRGAGKERRECNSS